MSREVLESHKEKLESLRSIEVNLFVVENGDKNLDMVFLEKYNIMDHARVERQVCEVREDSKDLERDIRACDFGQRLRHRRNLQVSKDMTTKKITWEKS